MVLPRDDDEPKQTSSELPATPKAGHKKVISFDASVAPPSVRVSRQTESEGGAETVMSTSSNSPTTTVRKAIRVAQPHLVERSESETTRVRPEHIIKIFKDDSEIAEVSPEQVERVKMMHDRIDEGASISFNYNVLLMVSSVLAALGLVSNGSTIIIASMLVSPLMGPVIGLAYATTILDRKLFRRSIRNESLSLLFCIVTGMVIAAITGPTALSEEWPTDEMTSRQLPGFLVALPVAFFSGLGVAVSLLDDQTSSLVGVAISASLLPPAVNTGVLWIAYFFDDQRHEDGATYGKSDYRDMGLISLALTLSNIVIVWIAAVSMFRVKEKLPIKKNVFWDDLGVARKIYQKRAVLKSCDKAPNPQSVQTEESAEERGGEED